MSDSIALPKAGGASSNGQVRCHRRTAWRPRNLALVPLGASPRLMSRILEAAGTRVVQTRVSSVDLGRARTRIRPKIERGDCYSVRSTTSACAQRKAHSAGAASTKPARRWSRPSSHAASRPPCPAA
ncbi:hypothetical protein MTO96_018884 [Rhipicephalus appendiculatus]